MKNNAFLNNSLKESVTAMTPLQINLSRSVAKFVNPVNESLNESGVSADISVYNSLIRAVIERTESNTVLPIISSYVKATTPSGKIPVVLIKYAGKDESIQNGVVLQVGDVTGFVEGGQISSASATGTVKYVEDKLILVDTLSGTWATGDSIDNAIPFVTGTTTIENVISSVVKAGTLFRQYAGDYTTAQGELLTKAQKNKFRVELKQIQYEAKTKTIHTGFTLEAIQDILAIYEDGYKKLVSAFTNIIIQEIEQDYIEWLRLIASPIGTVSLTASLGMQSGIRDTYTDILGKVNLSIGAIRRQTSIDGKWFIIGSPNVTQAMRTIDLVSNSKNELVNSKYQGAHVTGGFSMIEDSYAMDDYVVIGHSGIEGYDSGGAIFIPYNIDVVEAKNPDTLQTEVGIKIRYNYLRSPLDTKSANGESDFFQTFQVTGFTDLPNF